MEKIILGLLMLCSMSIYEIKTTINAKCNSMCSDSAGSIHTAMRVLMKKGYVGCEEDGRKKVYFITTIGRKAFTDWIQMPMNHMKVKNMETSKLFFMGMVPRQQVNPIIRKYIESLYQELDEMKTLYSQSTSHKEKVLEQSQVKIEQDAHNGEGIKSELAGRTMTETIADVYKYQVELLVYAIDSLHFEIDWYEKFLKRNQADTEEE